MRFKVKSGNTTFTIASGDEYFIIQDFTKHDIQSDKLTFTFNAETGDYQCTIENPSYATLRALERDKLYFGISTCDITDSAQDHWSGKVQSQYRPRRLFSDNENGKKVYWRCQQNNRFKITDLNNISFNIQSMSAPHQLVAQGEWVLTNIDKYGWPMSVFKDKISVDYKFVLVGLDGRVIRSYKNIYTVELISSREV